MIQAGRLSSQSNEPSAQNAAGLSREKSRRQAGY